MWDSVNLFPSAPLRRRLAFQKVLSLAQLYKLVAPQASYLPIANSLANQTLYELNYTHDTHYVRPLAAVGYRTSRLLPLLSKKLLIALQAILLTHVGIEPVTLSRSTKHKRTFSGWSYV